MRGGNGPKGASDCHNPALRAAITSNTVKKLVKACSEHSGWARLSTRTKTANQAASTGTETTVGRYVDQTG